MRNIKMFNKKFWHEVYLHLTDQWTEYQLSQYLKTLEEHNQKIEKILYQAAWLYGNTYYIEKQLTTEEKELLADVLERWVGVEDGQPYKHDRWWRNG